MDFIRVNRVPEAHNGKNKPSKWKAVADRLRETPGEEYIVASGLSKGDASSAVQALKRENGIGATSRSHDLPEGVKRVAVFAWYADPDVPPSAGPS
jgi:hypothetical protein